jgi:TolB-like protein
MHKIIKEKKYLSLSSLVLAVFFLIIFSSGCSPKHYFRRSTLKISNLKRIAVLPFQNLTAERYADEKVRRAVIIDLLSRGFDVIEPGEVTRTLRDMGIRPIDSMTSSDIMYIGETFDVKTVMIGSVATFGRGVNTPFTS